MDWNKTKNYLIASLIIVNLVLAVSMLTSSTNGSGRSDESEIRSVEEILALKNIRLSDGIDIRESRVMDVFGEYQAFSAEVVANGLIAFPKRMDEGAYTDGEYSVVSRDGGRRITYFSAMMEDFDDSAVEWTIQDPVAMVDDDVKAMLERADMPYSSLYLVKTAVLGELSVERYEHSSGGMLVESSGVTVAKAGGSIVYMDGRIADITLTGYSKAANVTWTQALQRFYSRFRPAGQGSETVVSRVELVYLLGPLESGMSLKSADGMAYWRIYTEDKQVYYIEAVR